MQELRGLQYTKYEDCIITIGLSSEKTKVNNQDVTWQFGGGIVFLFQLLMWKRFFFISVGTKFAAKIFI